MTMNKQEDKTWWRTPMTRLSLHYQKPRQMRNQNLIEAAFRKAIVATIYLQDKPEFMLSAKVNKILRCDMDKNCQQHGFTSHTWTGKNRLWKLPSMKAALGKSSTPKVYLRYRSETMLSKKINKKIYDVVWTKMSWAWWSPRIHERAQIDDESCPRQGQYTQSLPEIQIRNNAE